MFRVLQRILLLSSHGLVFTYSLSTMTVNHKNATRWPTTLRGWLLFAAFVGLLYFLNQRAEQPAPGVETENQLAARCVRVIDGDTLDVMIAGKTERIRLLGIDCMEAHNEAKQAQQAKRFGLSNRQVRMLSERAENRLRDRVLRKEVALMFDPKTPRRGGYGRLLGYVEIEGEDVALDLLQQGLAESRREPHLRKRRYEQEARSARAKKLGIWVQARD